MHADLHLFQANRSVLQHESWGWKVMLLSFDNAGITLAFCKMLLLFIKSLTKELEENNRKIGTISGKKMKKGVFKVDFICFPSLDI